MHPGGRDRSDSWEKARYRWQRHHHSGYRASAPGRAAGEREFLRTDHAAHGTRLYERGSIERFVNQGKWHRPLAAILASLLLLSACKATPEPAEEYKRVSQVLVHGDLVTAHQAAEIATRRYSRSPQWEWRFRILDATALTLSGESRQVFRVLGKQ